MLTDIQQFSKKEKPLIADCLNMIYLRNGIDEVEDYIEPPLINVCQVVRKFCISAPFGFFICLQINCLYDNINLVMKLSGKEKVELTNMCMIYDNNGNILVQDKIGRSWGGVTFPGGHIEHDESFNDSVIREIKEETGLDIKNLKLCGIKHWKMSKTSRYIVLLYKTNDFSGTLHSSEEGKVFWIKKEDLKNYKLADGFEDMFKVFDDDSLNEFMSVKENGEWIKKIC